MIGWSHEYNCASYAIDRINEIHGAGIKVGRGTEWQAAFLPYLRRWFTPIDLPNENCLVVMKALDGCLHLGIYRNYLVEHNYKPQCGAGCVIKSDLGTIRCEFNKRVRFYAYNKTV